MSRIDEISIKFYTKSYQNYDPYIFNATINREMRFGAHGKPEACYFKHSILKELRPNYY